MGDQADRGRPSQQATKVLSEKEYQDYLEYLKAKAREPLEQTAKAVEKATEETIKKLEKELEIGKAGTLKRWVSEYLYQLFLYLPNALVLFGPIVDTINQEFRYSLASIIGILSVFFNWFIGVILKVYTGAKQLPSAAGIKCTVPGFESWESVFSPQGIVLPAAIFSYILIDLGFHRSASENMGTMGLMFGFILAQLIVMGSNKCFAGYYFSSSLLTIITAMAIGVFCGLMGWVGVRFGAPQRLPSGFGAFSSATSPPTQKATNPLGKSTGPSDVATCSPPNDQDQFVCEAYKNGEVVTSTIVS